MTSRARGSPPPASWSPHATSSRHAPAACSLAAALCTPPCAQPLIAAVRAAGQAVLCLLQSFPALSMSPCLCTPGGCSPCQWCQTLHSRCGGQCPLLSLAAPAMPPLCLCPPPLPTAGVPLPVLGRAGRAAGVPAGPDLPAGCHRPEAGGRQGRHGRPAWVGDIRVRLYLQVLWPFRLMHRPASGHDKQAWRRTDTGSK